MIHSLPVALLESVNCSSLDELDAFRTAYETDMINLLVCPLAEAKHAALRYNECFGKNLMTVNALHYYGGKSYLEKFYDYLENFIADKSLQEEKIAELFDNAFQFIDSPVYWKAIERLACYILDNTKTTISCEEAIAVLDESSILARHAIETKHPRSDNDQSTEEIIQVLSSNVCLVNSEDS